MIRLNSFNRLRCGFVVFCSTILMVTTGCNRSFMNDEPEEPGTTAPAAPVYMSASIAVRATQADLASNSQNAEDEIAQLRILAFNSATGKLAINKFYGSAEQDQFSNQPAGTTAAWKGAFQIVPDKYDFFFIANENSWPEVKAALQAIRKSQWRWDFAVASHGASFHAPQEVTRILGQSLGYAQEARLAIAKVLAKHGFAGDVPMPDISSKEKAWAYIGLDGKKLQADKAEFLKTVVPKWVQSAKQQGKLIEL